MKSISKIAALLSLAGALMLTAARDVVRSSR